ncbi:BnaC03g27810D [Brassica napus]|uniref:BnaC03g27810D protein n=1 Tax=Brassica napus TaxID=3708 RepID=A0A078H9A0_BRANA|nr:BnaC03g27810D [Brassica napus]
MRIYLIARTKEEPLSLSHSHSLF